RFISELKADDGVVVGKVYRGELEGRNTYFFARLTGGSCQVRNGPAYFGSRDSFVNLLPEDGEAIDKVVAKWNSIRGKLPDVRVLSDPNEGVTGYVEVDTSGNKRYVGSPQRFVPPRPGEKCGEGRLEFTLRRDSIEIHADGRSAEFTAEQVPFLSDALVRYAAERESYTPSNGMDLSTWG
ncbi:hypothetical protein KY362_05455, partial [Candidatus Woesearchaeota archaeon]|nr:hypothetical protein [Candidatus Woesearchaeota archaeon]